MLPTTRRSVHPLPWLLAGLIALAAGLALAHRYLPEWRAAPFRGEAFYLARFRELARRAGVVLEPGPPRVVLGSNLQGLDLPFVPLEGEEPGSSPLLGADLLARISQPGFLAPDGTERRLEIGFSASGQPRLVLWTAESMEAFFAGLEEQRPDEAAAERFTRLLLASGETLGPARTAVLSGSPARVADIEGSRPPQHALTRTAQGLVSALRWPGPAAVGLARIESFHLTALLLRQVPGVLGRAAVLILFIVLAARRRIDLVNAAWLGAITAGTSLPGLFAGHPEGSALVLEVIGVAFQGLWVFVVWAAGESLVRSADPEFTTSLDSLRVGRIGPRGGRALLVGLGLGAALAGLRLALLAGAVALPGSWPEQLSLDLPVFGGEGNLLGQGILLAAIVTVALGAAARWFPRRWAPWAAAVAVPLLSTPVHLHPLALRYVAALAAAALLVATGRRFGLTALLVASVASLLLPAAVFSARHLAWLPGTFAVTAGISAAILGLGLVGLTRPEEVEMGRLTPPAFMRRIEDERRVRYEMDLLARMQRGLLPERLPTIAGWDIAAHSLLATEVGGDLYDFLPDGDGHLWIAEGDVAGHGYSCSVVQAMTTAALASLVGPGRTPAEVLQQVDRVIRRGATRRNFTSLALLRLDPRTGRGLLANAGHPYPLLVAGGEVREIALPGLPLGHGPAREYDDLEIEIPPGGVLVFCSDGLFEATDWSATQYGYERPREVLQKTARRPADAIAQALLADWRRHLGNEEPPDDTTVLVIKRAPA